MAWNPSPQVQVARDAAKRLGANVGCVIIYLTANPDNMGMVSYGANAALCTEMGKLGDELMAATKKHFE